MAEITPLTPQELDFAQLYIAGKSINEAAAQVGLNRETARRLTKHPEIVALIEGANARALEIVAITKAKILAKWWEFANIDPKLTDYNTTGQSRALDFLWKGLNFDAAAATADESGQPKVPDVYRSAWNQPDSIQ